MSSGIQNINHTLFITSKHLIMLGCILFIICLLRNTLFPLFFAVQILIPSVERFLLHFNLQKQVSYFAFTFVEHCWPFLLLILRFLNSKCMHCTLLICGQSRKTLFFPFRNHFNMEKRLRYLVCCLLLCEHVGFYRFPAFSVKNASTTLKCIYQNVSFQFTLWIHQRHIIL